MQTELDSLRPFIRAVDSHASHRLSLVDRVQSVPVERRAGDEGPRRALAERLERWRYQHMARRAKYWTDADRALSDALDTTACALSDGPPRLPRRARQALAAHLDAAGLADLQTWLDPASDLPALAARAEDATRQRFSVSSSDGVRRRRMRLYAPIYLANQCVNDCPYCGFHHSLDIARRRLTVDEVVRQAGIVRRGGICDVLLVAGDFPSLVATTYLAQIAERLCGAGMTVAVEIAPQSTSAYAALVEAGVCGLTLYQETYDERLYTVYHRRGPKAAFDWRLEGPERAAEAGMPRLGLGILVGLAPPAEDLAALIRHARYLQERFADRTLAFSLPRIHDAPAGFHVPFPVDDDTFLRMYCALRIAFPTAELVLSTREACTLRHRLAAICITQLSAGSSTAPGGYGDSATPGGEQFPVSDHRTPAEVAAWLRQNGFAVDA